MSLPTHDVHYEDRGTGTPVLLLGGSGEPMIAWEFCGLVEALLSKGHRVVWFAARGVRPSGCPPLPWSLDAMADDAISLLDHLQIEQVTGIGYSLGGFTLERMALRRPERIAAAVLMASAGGADGIVRNGFIDAENAFAKQAGQVPVHFSRLMTLMTALGGDELTNPETIKQWWELLAHQGDQWAQPHGEIGQAQVALDWKNSGGTTGSPFPDSVRISLLYFGQDSLFPAHEASAVARHLGSRTEIVTVENAGHAGLLTRPEETTDALLGLLERWRSASE
ncbi:alpha/beta fold hydrolase [Dietzia timorensis]|nr:alpha/beta hydrolase [Dietzia timorensis]